MDFYQKMNFIFSGIGTDYRDLIHNYDLYQNKLLKTYMQQSLDSFNINLLAYYDGGHVENTSLHNWIAIYTLDCIIYEEYKRLFIKPNCLMGYSMGLITALKCGNAISYEDGVNLLIAIRNSHKPSIVEGMTAIVGLNYESIQNIITSNSLENIIFIASENNENCFILSGLKEAILHFNELALKNGGRIGLIESDYAFHTDYLKDSTDKFSKIVQSLSLGELDYPLISSINQRWLANQEDIRQELILNLYKKMNWKDSIIKVSENNIPNNTDFIEVSLGKSITSCSQKINSNNKFYTYDYFFN